MPDGLSPTQQMLGKYLVDVPVEAIKGLLGLNPTDQSDIGKSITQRSAGTNANLLMQTLSAGLPFFKLGKIEPVLESTLDKSTSMGDDYISGILKNAGQGTPGFSENLNKNIITGQADPNSKFLAYRDPRGNPVAAARIIKDSDGNWMVEDLASDKSKGLLSGRAIGTLGKELISRGITTSSSTVSPEILELMKRIGLVK